MKVNQSYNIPNRNNNEQVGLHGSAAKETKTETEKDRSTLDLLKKSLKRAKFQFSNNKETRLQYENLQML